MIHQELNEDITDLEDEKDYYRNEIQKDDKAIKELSTEEGIEKMAREKYYMKKENEDIYIIEYEDSLKLKRKDE
nr:septum formation initiator family protein [Psychroserpens burtonensis]